MSQRCADEYKNACVHMRLHIRMLGYRQFNRYKENYYRQRPPNKSKIKLHLWSKAREAMNWFTNLNNKKISKLIQLDINNCNQSINPHLTCSRKVNVCNIYLREE